ncbi:MAG: GntR family transcriptional regulator [Ruminococcus sp.]|nr:GntR family transcriptional regulator [Ruminococcus sp.]
MFSLDLSSRVPIFEQLYNNIVRLISAGVLKPNDKIPPVRALATELSVNPNTVAKAYKLLEADGYICSAVGKGSFISPDLSVQSAEKQLALSRLEKEVKNSVSAGVTKKEIMEIVERWVSENDYH